MKVQILIQILVPLSLLCTPLTWAESNTSEFVEAVNAAWLSTNYPLLEETITNRVAEFPDDLLALGLRFEYNLGIIVDYGKARTAAQAYVASVSNRMPSEISERRVPVSLAMSLLEEPIPTNFPPRQLKTTEQMAATHKEFPSEFPFLFLYLSVPERIQKLEDGLITDENLILFKDSIFLGDEIPDEDE